MPQGPHLRFVFPVHPTSVQIMQIRGSVHSCRFGSVRFGLSGTWIGWIKV